MADGLIAATRTATTGAGANGRQRKLLWRTVEAYVIDNIARGNLVAGDRAPSLREMSRIAQVSISTVLQAYAQLEAQGYLVSRERSGFYVARQPDRSAEPSVIELSNSRPKHVAGEVIQQIMQSLSYKSVLPLGAATLSTSFLPGGALRRIAARIIRREHNETLNYQAPPGDRLLRQQIARRLGMTGAYVSPDDILITSGGMEALNLCLRTLCRPGDAVLVESPTYFGILQCLENLGLRALEIPNNPVGGIDPDHVRAAIKRVRIAAALLAPNFNNPTGSLTPDAAKLEIVRLLAAAEIPLIEDDVYGDLAFDSARPSVLKAYDRHDNVLTCGSISKTVAPGYRVGWIVSRRHRDPLIQCKLTTSLANSTLEQRIVGEFLRSGFDRHLRKLRGVLTKQVGLFSETVLRHFPTGTKVSKPGGGYVLWIELPGVDCLQLTHRALQHGISISPGTIFSATGAYQNFIRINCGLEWSPAVEQAIKFLGKTARELQA